MTLSDMALDLVKQKILDQISAPKTYEISKEWCEEKALAENGCEIGAGISKDDIAGLRGGYPDRCSWCEWPCPPELLEPEESSMWVCHHCMWEWETCDIAKADRPQALDYGVVKQRGSLDGVPVTIGGRDKTAHVILEDRNRSYTNINLTRDQAKRIAPCIYSQVIRLHGMGSWKRDDEGEWQLLRFKVDDFEILEDTPLHEILDHMRAIPGNGWADMALVPVFGEPRKDL